jgi:hypothetical protein
MNMRDIAIWGLASQAGTHHHDHNQSGPAPFWQRTLPRRQFARTVAGTAVVGATLGSGLWTPGLAVAHQSHKHRLHESIPIPGGLQAGGQTFHLFVPGLGSNPPDQEPSTITDFNGFVGLAYL